MYSAVRAVVFDAVGTLIYPHPAAPLVYHQVGSRYGSKLSPTDIQTRLRWAWRQAADDRRTDETVERARWRRIVAEVFVDVADSGSLFAELWDHFAQPKHWSVYDDVQDAWQELETRHLVIAIGSNFDDRLREIASRLTPLHRAQPLLISSQLGFAKPALEFFRAAERRLGLAPHELLMVGDDPTNDYLGASQAGWHSLHLRRDQLATGPAEIMSLREIVERLR